VPRLAACLAPARWLALAITLAGCATFPEVDALPPEAARPSPPRLVPIDRILTGAETAAPEGEAPGAALTARAEALRARAGRLQGPVTDPALRDRLAAAAGAGG
jgi:hypothetical protein